MPHRESILLVVSEATAGAQLRQLLGSKRRVDVVVCQDSERPSDIGEPRDMVIADSANAADFALELVVKWGSRRSAAFWPVLLVTDQAHEAAAIKFRSQGVTDYIIEPVSEDRLDGRVALLLELGRLRRQHAFPPIRNNKQFREFADTVALMMWLGDTGARCVDVNKAWLDFTGWQREQAIGLGWVDAIHPADRNRTVEGFQRAFRSRGPSELEYRLLRADGSFGWILDRGMPRYGPDGKFAGYIGWCTDISTHKESEERLRRVQALTAALSRALTPNQVAMATVDYGMRAVGASAAWLARVDADDRTLRLLETGGGQPKLWPRLAGQALADVPALARAVVTGEPVWLESEKAVRDQLAIHDIEVPGALAVLPVLIDSSEPGCLGLCLPRERTFLESERTDARIVAQLAEQALARAGRYATERRVARTLQRNLLPHHLPEIDGVQAAARYLPGTGEIEVGGDWYQVLRLADDHIGVVVGDVAGHGIQAAATMGILRNALNAYLMEGADPAQALDRSSRLLEHADDRTLATAFVGVLDRSTRVFQYATAGHPPPALRLPDGSVTFLEGPKRVPLGLSALERRPVAVTEFPLGAVLVGYTDGLIERRSESLDYGLERLLVAVRSGPDDVETLSDFLVERLTGPSHDDDIAILVLGLTPRTSLSMTVSADPTRLSVVRQAVGAWLKEHRVAPEDTQDVLLAVGEACANVVLHAYHEARDGGPEPAPGARPTRGKLVDPFSGLAEPRRPLKVSARIDSDELVVRVRDRGTWHSAGRAIGGRGLPIIRKVMDLVEIDTGEDGTTVKMQRLLSMGGRS